MTVLAAEGAAGAASAGGAGAAEGGGLGAAAGGAGLGPPGMPQMPGGSVAFAIAILLIGFACMGLWIAFHKPENAETGAFPGLFGQMLQWVHAGEESGGAGAANAGTGGPGGTGGTSGLSKTETLLQQIQGILDKLNPAAGVGSDIASWIKEHWHL